MVRLTRIITGTGDDGRTGIADGSRVDKDSDLIIAIGDVDELNSVLGVFIASLNNQAIIEKLQQLQQQLFNLGGDLSLPDSRLVDADAIKALEEWTQQMNESLPPLQEFVLPGGTLATAQAHHARTVCRRAERSVVRTSRQKPVNPAATIFLNRLSDLLFVLARALAAQDAGEEIIWKRT